MTRLTELTMTAGMGLVTAYLVVVEVIQAPAVWARLITTTLSVLTP